MEPFNFAESGTHRPSEDLELAEADEFILCGDQIQGQLPTPGEGKG